MALSMCLIAAVGTDLAAGNLTVARKKIREQAARQRCRDRVQHRHKMFGAGLQQRRDGVQLHSMSAGMATSTFRWVSVTFQAARRFKWDYSSIRKRLARVGGRLS